METTYRARIAELLEQACPKLSATHLVEYKNVFGAIAGYIDADIFISCGTFGVALRLPPEVLNHLLKENDVKHLKYFSNGHVKKEYAVLPKKILDDKRRLKMLMVKS